MGDAPAGTENTLTVFSAACVGAAFTEETLDNYIVRIYRREKDNPRLLVGLVEEVGVSGKRAFNSLDDLWEILNGQKSRDKKYQRHKKGALKEGGNQRNPSGNL